MKAVPGRNDENSDRKEKEKTGNKKGFFKAFCVIRKRNKTYDWTYVKITNASEILNLIRYYGFI